MIDLHIHTNYSGGKKDLSQILKKQSKEDYQPYR